VGVPQLMLLSAAVDRKNGQVYLDSELHTQTECISRLIKFDSKQKTNPQNPINLTQTQVQIAAILAKFFMKLPPKAISQPSSPNSSQSESIFRNFCL
jgi:hypothetical protein